MAITILERPEGYLLNTANVFVEISDLTGTTLVRTGSGVSNPHGLTTGDIIYITSFVADYNGFVIVEVIGVNSLLIKTLDGEYIPYISGVDLADQLAFYNETILTHGWSAVHLPITYRLSTNLYPTNSADTTRNINSVQDANGYTVLQLSGSLGTVHSYDFISITVPNDTELSGVYQILEYISDTVLLINLEYDSGNDFTSATAIKQYNNYNILVRVYAGINASHEWTLQKPYELAATLQFIPDSNNEVFFSINEILKSYVETRNNLLLGTLPNNIDFWVNFYIETAEVYDDSDGYTFGTTTSEYTSDQSEFEGTAVNSKLDFKNTYSGYLSEYLMVNSTGKFLTLFDIPVLFPCGATTPDCYSDISWLKIDSLPVTVRKEFYLNGDGPVTVDEAITEESGVIRTAIEADCDYDRVDVSLIVVNEVNSYSVTRSTVGQTSQDFDFFIPEGQTPPGDYSYSITLSGGTGSISAQTFYLNLDGTTETIVTVTRSTVGTTSLSSTDLPVPAKTVIGVRLVITIVDGGGGITANGNNAFDIDEADIAISETKQFKINCDCCNDEIRLSWLNNLGGFEPTWTFCGEKDVIREIQEAMTTKKNILPNWPKSYGSDADTIKKQTVRVSNKAYTIRSQFLTEDEVDALAYIKSSILVQIVNSRTDRRTVIVDTDSFIIRKDGDKTFEIAFNISFTDDISVQTL